MIEQDWLYTNVLEVTLTNKILMNMVLCFWNFNTFAGFANFTILLSTSGIFVLDESKRLFDGSMELANEPVAVDDKTNVR